MDSTERIQGGAVDGTQAEQLAAAREELASVIESRSQFYRSLSKLYYWPFSQEELDQLDTAALRELSQSASDPLVADGYNDMYRYLRRRNTGTRETLNADFTRCFMGMTTFKGLACVPYASVFLQTGGELMGRPRNEVRRVYRANRIELEDGIDLPEDHLSFEFEFMAIIGQRCAEALRSGDTDAALEQVGLQAQFMDEHILTWTDRFFNLAVELVQTRFYRGVLKVTKGFLSTEPELLRELAEEIEQLRG